MQVLKKFRNPIPVVGYSGFGGGMISLIARSEMTGAGFPSDNIPDKFRLQKLLFYQLE